MHQGRRAGDARKLAPFALGGPIGPEMTNHPK
jgi:hypothetical protein